VSSYVPLSQRTPPKAVKRRANRAAQLTYTGGAFAVILVVFALYFFVWHKDDPRLTGSCGIVVDGSGSANSATGFDTKKDIDLYVDDFLFDTGCRYVAFAPIDTSSMASKCSASAPVIDLDPDDIHNGQTDVPTSRQGYRKDAVTAAQGVYDCIQREPSPHNSDVLGGLSQIARVRPSQTGAYTVLAVSDFSHGTGYFSIHGLDLSTVSSRAAVIARIKKDDTLPDLTGIDLRTVGFGVLFASNPSKSVYFDAFWHELILKYAHAKSFRPYVNK